MKMFVCSTAGHFGWFLLPVMLATSTANVDSGWRAVVAAWRSCSSSALMMLTSFGSYTDHLLHSAQLRKTSHLPLLSIPPTSAFKTTTCQGSMYKPVAGRRRNILNVSILYTTQLLEERDARNQLLEETEASLMSPAYFSLGGQVVLPPGWRSGLGRGCEWCSRRCAAWCTCAGLRG